MNQPIESAEESRRVPLLVVAIIAVVASLGFVFAWPW